MSVGLSVSVSVQPSEQQYWHATRLTLSLLISLCQSVGLSVDLAILCSEWCNRPTDPAVWLMPHALTVAFIGNRTMHLVDALMLQLSWHRLPTSVIFVIISSDIITHGCLDLRKLCPLSSHNFC